MLSIECEHSFTNAHCFYLLQIEIRQNQQKSLSSCQMPYDCHPIHEESAFQMHIMLLRSDLIDEIIHNTQIQLVRITLIFQNSCK